MIRGCSSGGRDKTYSDVVAVRVELIRSSALTMNSAVVAASPWSY